MQQTTELVMYSRSMGCPYVSLAKQVLAKYDVPFREVMIDLDDAARQRVEDWTGFLSVPTLIVATSGENLPITEPEPLAQHSSPRGVNRGSMITEPGVFELTEWLQQHDFIQDDAVSK